MKEEKNPETTEEEIETEATDATAEEKTETDPTAARIAALRGTDTDTLLQQTAANARQLFHL